MTDRMARVNDLLRDTLAEVVAGELKDPRLDVPLLSVTEVRASRDLRRARALVSVMPEPNAPAEAQAAALQTRSPRCAAPSRLSTAPCARSCI